MKHCPRCTKDKDLSEFRPNRKRKDGYQQYCIPCDKEYQREWYNNNKESAKKKSKISNKKIRERNQEFIISYLKEHPCCKCGESDIVVLEFDHIRDKKFEISKLIKGNSSFENLKVEIEKCQVLCANCHKRKTAKDFKWYKNGQ